MTRQGWVQMIERAEAGRIGSKGCKCRDKMQSACVHCMLVALECHAKGRNREDLGATAHLPFDLAGYFRGVLKEVAAVTTVEL